MLIPSDIDQFIKSMSIGESSHKNQIYSIGISKKSKIPIIIKEIFNMRQLSIIDFSIFCSRGVYWPGNIKKHNSYNWINLVNLVVAISLHKALIGKYNSGHIFGYDRRNIYIKKIE